MNKIYTGIGSRQTPENVLLLMYNLGIFLGAEGYTLRSGGAEGADSSFEDGCKKVNGKMQIYLPWDGFCNKHYSWNQSEFARYPLPTAKIWSDAEKIVAPLVSNWEQLRPPVKILFKRNVFQVLGLDLTTPSKFIVCWTENGELKGGTRIAMMVAQKYGVPIYNLANSKIFDNFTNRIKNER